MAPGVKKRDSAPYIRPGIERDMQLRMTRHVRFDMEHLHKLATRKLKEPPTRAFFLAFLASVGADAIAHHQQIPGAEQVTLGDDLDAELATRSQRPLKQELKQRYLQVYEDLLPPKFGEFIVYSMLRGSDLVRDKYVSRSQQP